jgi:hypothetical protein
MKARNVIVVIRKRADCRLSMMCIKKILLAFFLRTEQFYSFILKKAMVFYKKNVIKLARPSVQARKPG